MKSRGPGAWLVSAVAAAAGIAVGACGAALQATLTPWRIGDLAPVLRAIPPDAPRVEVAEPRHEFGTMGMGTGKSHRFEIRNTGGGPLTLTRGGTSCSCTLSQFESAGSEAADSKQVVPVGESAFVTLTWTGKPPGGFIRQHATILTDDPRRPEVSLVVEGMVVPTWRADPSPIVLPRINASSKQRASTTVFTYGAQPPRVKGLTIDHPQAPRFFSLASAPLAAEQIAAEPGATGGFRIDVDVEPGLPFGRLRQTITTMFEIPEEVTAEITIEGAVGGDLVLVGAGWDSSRQTLELGNVSSRVGMKTRIFLSARGPHRESVRPTVEERVPESLEVTVGEGSAVGSGAVMRFPIDIVIPAGSRPANHVCSQEVPAGRIVLATGHPDEPRLSIPVCVVIGP
ncbi:MAG: DUF1573 domain-containing protein [Planctomycetes bacterium]|nr:DUF1573 domain-containing protein [Planctomycetota bacterium]